MQRYGSYLAVLKRWPNIRIDSLDKRLRPLLKVFGGKIVIDVCTHKNIESWDYYKYYSYKYIYMNYQCSKCGYLFADKNPAPIGFIHPKQYDLIVDLCKQYRNLLYYKKLEILSLKEINKREKE